MLKVLILTALVAICKAAPGGVAVGASAGGFPPLFSFDNGGVGVNFLGYKASAGLGGLLTGNAADGGLHASAGTPYGQAAGAGLGGVVDGNGKTAGGLYAGATAGGGVSAGAGLDGETSVAGSYGKTYAGSSVGGVSKHVTKVVAKPAVVSGSISASVDTVPVVHKQVETIAYEQPKTTYVERTVIPNYVEKTIRVPTYVEKRIRVPAEPTIVEKEVSAPAHVSKTVVETNVAPVTYVEKTKIHHHPHHSRVHVHKHINSYGGGIGYGAGYGGVGTGNYQATVTKTASPQFFRDIFNIPISTLGAVSNLVSGIAGGAGGSLSVSKSVSAGVY